MINATRSPIHRVCVSVTPIYQQRIIINQIIDFHPNCFRQQHMPNYLNNNRIPLSQLVLPIIYI